MKLVCSFRNAEDSVLMSATAGISDVIAPPTAPPTSDKGPMSLRLRKMSSSESEMIPASPSKAGTHKCVLMSITIFYVDISFRY